ncbi:hypothetical protein XELAEV_18013560mg [Xenopus laevis]|uniref:Uncharacterized protein n=1 Tax=Xenopus laevis TaxID=8355 RepID=A0A974HZA3_XENLA|nr:hypothetical protein XELAEV_18013560mg [Xenopus laevis]
MAPTIVIYNEPLAKLLLNIFPYFHILNISPPCIFAHTWKMCDYKYLYLCNTVQLVSINQSVYLCIYRFVSIISSHHLSIYLLVVLSVYWSIPL